LKELVTPETAGDPMGQQQWCRSSLRYLSRQLTKDGHTVSPPTVGRLLRQLDYSLKVNVKQKEGPAHPDRDQQFQQIEKQVASFREAGRPIISVDTKKKELIGDFKNAGQSWCQEPERVNVHDFPSDALGRAVPYGIYDLRHNRGSVYVGDSADTPQFAVTAIAQWWQDEGQALFPGQQDLLILADAGGSNSCRARDWKRQLQTQLCDRWGLTVTVCHYPTGCSKWNPIEHRLFNHISINWAGKPLRDWDVLLGCIKGTTTTTGLRVQAFRLAGEYPKGQRVSDDEMAQLNLERDSVCSNWNYTICPRSAVVPDT
jgi:hypothetical protein